MDKKRRENEELLKEIRASAYWFATQQLQKIYELTSDFNEYEPHEHQHLKNYIGYALYGPPKNEVEDVYNAVYKYEEAKEKVITSIYEKIVEHGVQENKCVHCIIIYLCIYDEKKLLKHGATSFNDSIHLIPVFKVEKITTNNDFFISTDSRVYRSWCDFLENNNFPACTIIAPKDGKWQANLKETWSSELSCVEVEIHSNHSKKYLTQAVDTMATVVSIGSIGVGIAAVLTPVTAPLALAGVVGGTVSGIWQGGRSVADLYDRKKHDESITDKNSIPAWIGIAGSVAGTAANSGSAIVSKAVRTGTTIPKGLQIAHDTFLVGNLIVNSVGVGFTTCRMLEQFKETGQITKKDVFFLAAHLFFTCNSALNLKFAKQIIKSGQNQIMEDYANSLRSNRHRKELNRMMRNTGKQISDEVQRNEQIIRGLNQINNKDEFFASMIRNRQTFASTGTKPSFCADGFVKVGENLIAPSSFESMSKQYVKELVNGSHTTNLSANKYLTLNSRINLQTNSGQSLLTGPILLSTFSFIKGLCVKKMSNKLSDADVKAGFGKLIAETCGSPKQSKIFQILIDYAYDIYKVLIDETKSCEKKLCKIASFAWDIVRVYFPNLPAIDIEKLIEKLKDLYSAIKNDTEKWQEIYKEYCKEYKIDTDTFDNNSTLQCSEFEEEMDTDLPTLLAERILDSSSQCDDVNLIDIDVLVGVKKEDAAVMFKYAMGNRGTRPSQEMIELCKKEINDFVFSHPSYSDLALHFDNILQCDSRFTSILHDIKLLEQRNIIFYKLIVVAINILQDETGMELKAIEFTWAYIKLNFMDEYGWKNKLEEKFGNYIIRILIAIYHHQIADPEKWQRGLHFYNSLL